MLKLRFLGGERLIVPVTAPTKEISDVRALFATYRIIRKQIAQTKNRIHSLLKENLFPFADVARKISHMRPLWRQHTRTACRTLPAVYRHTCPDPVEDFQMCR
ncbi:MAG: hypothetical protein LBK63_06280 [Treponema sp.]|jgi:hypothetical protein|nr:hypothetical protein [Treponema sp.]